MLKYKTFLLTLFILSLVGSTVLAGELIIPKDTWEPIFFKSINELSHKAELKSLRDYFLTGDDLEIRFWSGFGLQPLSGFVLKRSNGVWSGLYVAGKFPKTGLAVESMVVIPQHGVWNGPYVAEKFPKTGLAVESRAVTPQRGWDYLWQQLDANGIMTLPDASQLKDEVMVLDGTSYVVELNYHNQYRTYQYGNPDYQPWPEAAQIQKIAHLLNKELLGQGSEE